MRTREVAQEIAKEGCKDRLGPIRLLPARLVSGLVEAGAGALIGHLHGGMSRSDLKETGEMLHESEAPLIVVGGDRAGHEGGKGTSEGNRKGDRRSVAS